MKNTHEHFTGLSRRWFLKAAAAAGFLMGLPRSAYSMFIKKFPVRTVEKDTFSFDPQSGNVSYQNGKTEPYSLKVDGLVESPVSFSYQELRQLPQVEQVSDFHCVEGWSVADIRWKGLRLAEVLKHVKINPEAKFAVFHSLGQTTSQPSGQSHYLESFPLTRLTDVKAEILLVLDMNDEPLPLDHGAPLRVISPYDLAYKSIKYVERIELAAEAREGWWTLANPIYPIEAPVPEHRLRKKS
jgi:DMSO/TMAO reductase YedYZ molybdopterin-dependent catalytic subunit